ncbi:type II toxin-antitoxin system VapC family toxin [uncultured Enterovirga sp.]|uniref:type II toxin-antitoxin system VapC family toxin n=1 Tax=uncultured Enterovirga sp. TaxID=2026352 RepID=UPI0035C9CED0
MIILDTNVLSEVMREAPSPQVLMWLSGQEPARLWTTAVSQAEIMVGITVLPPSRKRAALASAAQHMFKEDFADRIVPFDQAAASWYADVMAHCRRVGRPIKAFDGLIAGIARARGAAVATRDILHFRDCGLTLHDPWQEGGTSA